MYYTHTYVQKHSPDDVVRHTHIHKFSVNVSLLASRAFGRKCNAAKYAAHTQQVRHTICSVGLHDRLSVCVCVCLFTCSVLMLASCWRTEFLLRVRLYVPKLRLQYTHTHTIDCTFYPLPHTAKVIMCAMRAWTRKLRDGGETENTGAHSRKTKHTHTYAPLHAHTAHTHNKAMKIA